MAYKCIMVEKICRKHLLAGAEGLVNLLQRSCIELNTDGATTEIEQCHEQMLPKSIMNCLKSTWSKNNMFSELF